MDKADQRANDRIKVAIHAVVTDREQQNAVRSMVKDASICGCKIISKQVPDLPDEVLLKVPNLDQLIKGRIVWRNHTMAGIQFEWNAVDPDDRRKAPRQEVEIQAVISDRECNKLTDCVINDANSIGCRITNAALYTVPDDVHIEVEGLTEPVLAKVIWRNGIQAGLEFYWECDIFTLDDSLAV